MFDEVVLPQKETKSKKEEISPNKEDDDEDDTENNAIFPLVDDSDEIHKILEARDTRSEPVIFALIFSVMFMGHFLIEMEIAMANSID